MIERRKQTRTKIACPVYFIGSDKDGNVTSQDIATGININENGMLIESDSFINARFLQIMMTTKNKATVKISASIIYSMPADKGKFRTGVSFDEAPEATALFIEETLKASSSGEERSN